MSDLFGAPIGIAAAETDMRQNVLGALQAQKTLGEIGQQPADLELKQAHAKLFGAEAVQKDLANQMAANDLALSQKFQQQEAQEKIATLAANGQIATINDVGQMGKPAPNDPAARLTKYIKFLEDNGMSETRLLPLRKELADISEKGAIGNYRNSQAAEQQQKVVQARANRQGQMATAALNDPSVYPMLLQQALNDPDPEIRAGAAKLPTTWGPTTARIMQAVRTQGMDTYKAAEVAIQQAKLKSEQGLATAQTANAQARTSLAQARTNLENEKLKLVQKYGGDTAEATLEQKRATTAAKKDLSAAKDSKDFPAMPLDPKSGLFVVGGRFTDKQGRKLQMVGRDASGLPTFEPVGKIEAKKILESPVAGPAEEED